MRIAPDQRIDYATEKARALAFLAGRGHRDFVFAAQVGEEIWPDCNLRAQGLGGAASRILKRMEKEGLARWSASDRR